MDNNNNNYRFLLLGATMTLIATVGTATDYINTMYELAKINVKDVYADNILTQSSINAASTLSILNRNNNIQNCDKDPNVVADNKVLAKLTGEDAKKILNVLEDGKCINFRVVEINDKENSNLVIELVEVDDKI